MKLPKLPFERRAGDVGAEGGAVANPATLLHSSQSATPSLNKPSICSNVAVVARGSTSTTHISPTERTTWPQYLKRLYDESLAAGGQSWAKRQIRTEIAFWRGADAEGWWPLEAREEDGCAP